MVILVTGGTGLVGSRLLLRFVGAGVNCRALVRQWKAIPAGATRVVGSLLDANSFQEAVEGVSAIANLAGIFQTPDQDAICGRI